ncbi:MAG TPA: sporulation integral membrane protein YlbJ [Clostridium sp.]|nr:sporulation integral membrane protein YlbJ [Clostridium sp.]
MITTLRILPFLLLICAMFYYPQEVLKSASAGLSLWANYLLPALFPFFVVSDLLMKQGFVHVLGVLLEPLMRPLFRLPGKASFVLAMTHTSGIPIGAILTCKMRKEGAITRIEGERLLAFTCNPSPGFMFGALASGMLSNPALGIIIAGSIYLSNFIVGLLFRFYGQDPNPGFKHDFSFRRAWRELRLVQKENKKPTGKMLADAVHESVSTILLVGGFIVFFSVITHLMSILRINAYLAQGVTLISGGLLSTLGANALVQGLIESTIGCKATISAFSSLNSQVGMLTFILGWGGISVLAQVASFTASTDLRLLPFVLGRVLHSFLALIISQILLLFSEIPAMSLPISLTGETRNWLLSLRWSAFYFIGTIFLLMVIGLIGCAWRKAKR